MFRHCQLVIPFGKVYWTTIPGPLPIGASIMFTYDGNPAELKVIGLEDINKRAIQDG